MYIYESEHWRHFIWDANRLAAPLEDAARKQGLLLGRLSALGPLHCSTTTRKKNFRSNTQLYIQYKSAHYVGRFSF